MHIDLAFRKQLKTIQRQLHKEIKKQPEEQSEIEGEEERINISPGSAQSECIPSSVNDIVIAIDIDDDNNDDEEANDANDNVVGAFNYVHNWSTGSRKWFGQLPPVARPGCCQCCLIEQGNNWQRASDNRESTIENSKSQAGARSLFEIQLQFRWYAGA